MVVGVAMWRKQLGFEGSVMGGFFLFLFFAPFFSLHAFRPRVAEAFPVGREY